MPGVEGEVGEEHNPKKLKTCLMYIRTPYCIWFNLEGDILSLKLRGRTCMHAITHAKTNVYEMGD